MKIYILRLGIPRLKLICSKWRVLQNLASVRQDIQKNTLRYSRVIGLYSLHLIDSQMLFFQNSTCIGFSQLVGSAQAYQYLCCFPYLPQSNDGDTILGLINKWQWVSKKIIRLYCDRVGSGSLTSMEPILYMCDALNRNVPKELKPY